MSADCTHHACMRAHSVDWKRKAVDCRSAGDDHSGCRSQLWDGVAPSRPSLSHGVEERAGSAALLLGLNVNRRVRTDPTAEKIVGAAKFVKGGTDGA